MQNRLFSFFWSCFVSIKKINALSLTHNSFRRGPAAVCSLFAVRCVVCVKWTAFSVKLQSFLIWIIHESQQIILSHIPIIVYSSFCFVKMTKNSNISPFSLNRKNSMFLILAPIVLDELLHCNWCYLIVSSIYYNFDHFIMLNSIHFIPNLIIKLNIWRISWSYSLLINSRTETIIKINYNQFMCFMD